MADSGATVHALRPNPGTVVHLARNLTGLPAVHLWRQAVADQAAFLVQTVRLLSRKGFSADLARRVGILAERLWYEIPL